MSVTAQHLVNEHLLLSWDPVGQGTLYYGEFTRNNGGSWLPLFSGLTDTTFLWYISEEPEGDQYRVRVRAFDGALYGPWDTSDLLWVEHPPLRPTWTQVPRAGQKVDRGTDFAWKAVKDPGDDSVTYVGEYSYDGGQTWEALFSTTQTSRRVDFTKMPAGDVQVRLSASDGALPSPYRYSPVFRVDHLSEWLYERLPELTRERDETSGGHLKQLLDVLGFGLADIRLDAENMVLTVDVDTCPVEQLPYLGALLGFEFPYDLSEDQQRSFVRNAVALYRVKGTVATMKLVVSRMIGRGFQVSVENESHIAKTFDVVAVAADPEESVDALEKKLTYMVKLYSPAGMIPTVIVRYIFAEESSLAGRLNDADDSAKQYAVWRFNYAQHTTNGSIRLNEVGVTTLTL